MYPSSERQYSIIPKLSNFYKAFLMFGAVKLDITLFATEHFCFHMALHFRLLRLCGRKSSKNFTLIECRFPILNQIFSNAWMLAN